MAAFLEIANRMFQLLEREGVVLDERVKSMAVEVIRREHPGERAYIVPLLSRKDPDKAKAISEAAKRLPTGVVAARFGITAHAVRYHQRKKGKTPAA